VGPSARERLVLACVASIIHLHEYEPDQKLDICGQLVQMNTMARFRPIRPQAGLTGWVTDVKGYPNRGTRVVVQDQEGKEWTLSSINVDCGYEFEYFGHWVEEWRPGLLNCLERELVSEYAETQSEEVRQIRQGAWAMKQKILVRNGRSPMKECQVNRLPATMQMAVAC
jgi:hypothetical protein